MLDAPIGILDSGSGGLSILNILEKELPHESFIYIGDHLHLPYADKKIDEIQLRVCRIIEYLLSLKTKAIVIACNTATVAGIDIYRSRFPQVPILGVVPVIKTAAEITKTNKILVLSTPFTANSEYQKRLIKSFASEKIVYSVGCPELVPLVEKGITDGNDVKDVLSRIIEPYLKKDIDVIALGCTHYPFLLGVIHDIINGNDVHILDSSGAVMRQLKRVLRHNGIEATSGYKESQFYTTGDEAAVSKVGSLLLKKDIYFHHVNI